MNKFTITTAAAAVAVGALVAGPLTSASGAPSQPAKPAVSAQAATTGTPVTIQPGQTLSATATCTGTKILTGGGGSTSAFDLFLTDSYPSASKTWTVFAKNTGTTAQTLTPYVVCIG